MSSPVAVRDKPIQILYVGVGNGVAEQVDTELEDGAIESDAAATADEAVDAVESDQHDCVVVGDGVAGTDTVEVVRRLREDYERLPVVWYTEQGGPERAREAAAADVTEYLPTTADRDDTALLAERVHRLAERERDRRRTAQKELQLARDYRHLDSLLDSVPLPVIEFDASGEVLRWNQGAVETFGWSSAEAVGRYNPVVPDDEREAFEQLLAEALDGERITGREVVARTKAGEELVFLLSAAPVPGPDGEPESISAVLNDITAQKRMEHRLRELQETAQQLGVAPSIENISEIAIQAAEDVLGLEVTGLWRYDERNEALRPVAVTEEGHARISEIPTFTPGNSLAWTAFEDGEVRFYGDLRTVPGRYNPETAIRSEIIVPLGEQGVLVTGSTEPRQFSDADVDLFRILGATVEAALVRANREQQLRRQNERLEQFADVLAHDLRNPLATASGYLDLARESGDPEQFERVEAAHDRIEQLIEDLLTLARADTTVDEREPIDVAESATDAWSLVDTEGLSLSVCDPPVVSGDPSRLRQLFENLFRNAVEHGSTSNRASLDDAVEHGSGQNESRVTEVTVGALADDEGFYVEDDGVGIPEARRDEVFGHGVSFSDEGTGFGLSIVADIARAHGWTTAVGESAEGGARFEFSTAGRGNA